MFNIIARRTLLEYCEKLRDASSALQLWYHKIQKLDIHNFNELKSEFPTASIISDERVVFNICGNRYRLVVRVSFEFRAIQIKWFGKHSEYNRINVATIKFKKNEI